MHGLGVRQGSGAAVGLLLLASPRSWCSWKTAAAVLSPDSCVGSLSSLQLEESSDRSLDGFVLPGAAPACSRDRHRACSVANVGKDEVAQLEKCLLRTSPPVGRARASCGGRHDEKEQLARGRFALRFLFSI